VKIIPLERKPKKAQKMLRQMATQSGDNGNARLAKIKDDNNKKHTSKGKTNESAAEGT
jgi:hypothetical protein